MAIIPIPRVTGSRAGLGTGDEILYTDDGRVWHTTYDSTPRTGQEIRQRVGNDLLPIKR